ncbi:ComF family protein [bacterium]|nr:ComF family protein [bacterium]
MHLYKKFLSSALNLVPSYRSITTFVKNVITPSSCVLCVQFLNDPDTFFCSTCYESLMPLATSLLKITDTYRAVVYAVTDYKDPLRSLVLAKHNRKRLAAYYLGRLLWEKTDLKYADFDYVVPVPLHWTRYAWRWFNQSEVMAEVISQKSGKPVIHLVKRSSKTVSQAGLTRFDRIKNVQTAFELTEDAHKYCGAKLLFVDDVMTTGTTLQAVIKKTVSLKPSSILVAVACRVV